MQGLKTEVLLLLKGSCMHGPTLVCHEGLASRLVARIPTSFVQALCQCRGRDRARDCQSDTDRPKRPSKLTDSGPSIWLLFPTSPPKFVPPTISRPSAPTWLPIDISFGPEKVAKLQEQVVDRSRKQAHRSNVLSLSSYWRVKATRLPTPLLRTSPVLDITSAGAVLLSTTRSSM